MYYEAQIYHASELYVNNDPNQGCNPSTYQDNGLLETITAPTIEQLGTKLKQSYSYIEHFEDNRFESGYESIERDGTYVANMVTILISKVIKDELNPTKQNIEAITKA